MKSITLFHEVRTSHNGLHSLETMIQKVSHYPTLITLKHTYTKNGVMTFKTYVFEDMDSALERYDILVNRFHLISRSFIPTK